MVLPAAAVWQGVVLWSTGDKHALCMLLSLSVVGALRLGSEQNKTHMKKMERTYKNEYGPKQKPHTKFLSTPAERKTIKRLPRAQQCSDCAQTSTTVSGRPSSAKTLNVCPNVLRAYEEIRSKTDETLTIVTSQL